MGEEEEEKLATHTGVYTKLCFEEAIWNVVTASIYVYKV